MKMRSLLLVVSLMMVLAVACAPKAQPTVQPTAAPTATAVLPTPVPPTPVPKVLRVAVTTEGLNMDPQNYYMSETVICHIHQGLFKLDKNLVPQPLLAESATVSDDGLTWTIKLKKGIIFHDGTPFTADAVKAIVDKTLGDEPPTRSSFIGRSELESAQVLDDYTVEIKTKNPVGSFLCTLSGPAWFINSPAAYEKYGEEAGNHPVGTGPYRLVEWVKDEQVILERNPDYWGTTQPYYDRLIFKVVGEDSTRVALLEAGEVDAIAQVPPSEIPRLEQDPNIVMDVANLNRILYIAINCQLPYLDDVRVRQAMNYAVDKQAIVASIVGGLGEEAISPVPRLTWGHAEVGRYSYDPAKAKQLLTEAGVPARLEVSIWVRQGRYFQGEEVAEAVANYLRDVGLKVTVDILEGGIFNESVRKPFGESEVVMYELGWVASNMDADLALTPLFHSSQWPPTGANRGFYENPKVDELLDLARITVDLEERKALYEAVQRVIWDEAPWIFLHYMKLPNAHRKGITGLFMWPTERWDLLEARPEQ